MENLSFVEVPDPRAIITGKDRELWLPLSESPRLSDRTQTVNCAGAYFDVVGYSEIREALLLSPILIDGSANNLEKEVGDFLAQQ